MQGAGLRVMLSERADAPHIREVLVSTATPKATISAVAIGPEGGWTDDELATGRAAGFCEGSLGPLILRTETAVISALSILNFALAPHTD
jgi:16S rRNA (uracil1498-N3)-methyltransferase